MATADAIVHITLNSPMTAGSQINFFGRDYTSGVAQITDTNGVVLTLGLEHRWFNGLSFEIDLRTNTRTWSSQGKSIEMSHEIGLTEINIPDLHQCFSFYGTQYLSRQWVPVMESMLNTPLPAGTTIKGANVFDNSHVPIKTYRDAFMHMGVSYGYVHKINHNNHCSSDEQADCRSNCKIVDDTCVYECHYPNKHDQYSGFKDFHYHPASDERTSANSVMYEDIDGRLRLYPMPGYPDSVGLDLELEGTKIVAGYSR